MLSDRNADSPVFDQPADQRSTTTTVPPAPAAVVDDAPMIILAPLADSDIRVTSPGVLAWDTSGAASGAVVAPDGTVYSIAVSPHPSWLPDTADWEAIPPERRDIGTVAGRQVAAVVDESAPGQIYRTVRDDCWSIEITTADAPMWSADLATLLGTMGTSADAQRDNDAPVSVHVPEGWTSLGGGLVPRGWTMELFVDVDGESHIVYLAQRPAAPVGMLLSGESNPVPFDHDGQQWWSIDVVTTPGRTTVVGDAGLGAFYINSDLSRDQLVTIIDSLVPTRSDMIPQAGLAPSDTVVDEMATELDSDVPFDTALDTVAGSVPSDVVTEASPSVPVASAPEGTPPSSGCGVPLGLSLIES